MGCWQSTHRRTISPNCRACCPTFAYFGHVLGARGLGTAAAHIVGFLFWGEGSLWILGFAVPSRPNRLSGALKLGCPSNGQTVWPAGIMEIHLRYTMRYTGGRVRSIAACVSGFVSVFGSGPFSCLLDALVPSRFWGQLMS